MKLITVFTPTYNRENTLRRCYESLIMQTSKNFVWQIIDDGSSDGTEELIHNFIADEKIEIMYIKKQNGGKVSAINKSLEITKTELWICLDSDDYFFPDAIATYEKLYPEIRNKKNICGLFSVRSNPDKSPMQGYDIPENILYDTQFNLRYKYKIAPEYVQVYKTKIISKYRFPIFDGEKYIPLSYMQDQIDQCYKFFVFHEPTMVCEYQENGITHNQKRLVKNNPKGYTEFKRQQIIFSPNLVFKIKACITYDTGCILSNEIKKIFLSPCISLTMICFPIAILDYQLRYKKI